MPSTESLQAFYQVAFRNKLDGLERLRENLDARVRPIQRAQRKMCK